MGLVGARRFPLEDVPRDAFDRVLPREIPPRPGQVELIASMTRLYAGPRAVPPRFKRLVPEGIARGVFGGRWLPRARGFVVWAHPDEIIERAVTLHENVHALRARFVKDCDGEHDEGFLALAEDAYRTYGVPVKVAKLVEGQYPSWWNW